MADTFRITGRHVLATIVGFFLVVIIANMIFMTLAIRTFPGEQEEKSYLQGLNYNQTLAERAEQEKLGWRAAGAEATRGEAGGRIAIVIEMQGGAPVDNLAVSGVLARPADDDHDVVFDFVQAAPGRYEADLPAMAPGQWAFRAAAGNDLGQEFRFETKLVLE